MKKHGFTLIEMVVSVIILAIVAAIGTNAYTIQKRQSEYNGAHSIAMSLASAARNQYHSTFTTTNTASTLATNTQYQLGLSDGVFRNYRVIAPAVAANKFDISVQYAPRAAVGDMTVTATYTFDNNGTRTGCVGADCLP